MGVSPMRGTSLRDVPRRQSAQVESSGYPPVKNRGRSRPGLRPAPADFGLVAAVTVLAAIDSMKSGKPIALKPDDFRV